MHEELLRLIKLLTHIFMMFVSRYRLLTRWEGQKLIHRRFSLSSKLFLRVWYAPFQLSVGYQNVWGESGPLETVCTSDHEWLGNYCRVVEDSRGGRLRNSKLLFPVSGGFFRPISWYEQFFDGRISINVSHSISGCKKRCDEKSDRWKHVSILRCNRTKVKSFMERRSRSDWKTTFYKSKHLALARCYEYVSCFRLLDLSESSQFGLFDTHVDST